MSLRSWEQRIQHLGPEQGPISRPEDGSTVGDCLECGQYIYEEDDYEDLGDSVIHQECLGKQEFS